ncbi:regulatory protein RecX [Erythrobacter sp.]|jgi:regulatory protein|uniref:regulatory protein RecX n=1 Tax=Erythrobacter sp. TaxID=1042 RepID=UPI002EACA0DD|nr:RecX family transcriptional regulator [Erythrobacter sp.]
MVSHRPKTSSRRSDIPDEVAGTPRRGGGPKTRERKKKRPLDEAALRDLALSYAARFATTGAKLEAYLARKIRERGLAEDEDGRRVEPDIAALAARLIELGYVDDDAYARGRSRDLTARGYGARRVEQALWAAGVEDEVRSDNAPGEAECRRAAILLAKKRRFGPFGAEADTRGEAGADRAEAHKRRGKQVAAMLRAGHQYAHAAFILDAAHTNDIDAWLEEAEEDREEGRW